MQKMFRKPETGHFFFWPEKYVNPSIVVVIRLAPLVFFWQARNPAEDIYSTHK